jgi:hypothetical protein
MCTFLTLALDGGKCLVSCPSHSTLRNESWYALDRWVPEQPGHCGKDWESNPCHPACSLITILTEFWTTEINVINMLKEWKETVLKRQF